MIDLVNDEEIPHIVDSPEPFVKVYENACSSDTIKKESRGKLPHATLIVCPLSVMENWKVQFQRHLTPNTMIDIYFYYGPGQKLTPDELSKKDVVITTYTTLTSAWKKTSKPLHSVNWFRIILDEGHMIRNPKSQQSKACCDLYAERRWVLTGTPIQNHLLDFYSLIRFLRVKPFDDRTEWKIYIERFMISRWGGEQGNFRVRTLVKSLAIRRLKTQLINGRPIVALPSRHFEIVRVKFSDDERIMYDKMHKDGKVIVNRYVREGTLLHNYAHVLAIILRLRQLCCHPFLVRNAAEKAKQLGRAVRLLEEEENVPEVNEPPVVAQANGLTKKKMDELVQILKMVIGTGSDEECPICLDSLKEPVITPCAHVYCETCFAQLFVHVPPGAPINCPMCRKDVTAVEAISVPDEPEPVEKIAHPDDDWQSSAKVDTLMKHLTDLRIRDKSIKSVVVSQFTQFLDLIEVPLQKEKFRFVRLDGKMNQNQRIDAIREFSDSNSSFCPTVFLLSMSAGGVGISLTPANHVFLMDLAWNPAVEEQCADRCHRMGQTKDVHIVKFVVENSIEERMLEIQERKRRIMEDAFDIAKIQAANNRNQRIEDIHLLMR